MSPSAYFRKARFVPTVLFLALSNVVFAQFQEILPEEIGSGNATPGFGSHLVGVPSGEFQGKLVLFFPGTRSVPAAYQKFAECSLENGYHFIGLSYPNDFSISSLFNSAVEEEEDGQREQARNELLKGVDTSPFVDYSWDDSLQGRLLSLLIHLHVQEPEAEWNQFLPSFEIDWKNIIVCGHSQGANHALFIAYQNEVARCICFAGLDWVSQKNAPAKWVCLPFETPKENLYFFSHRFDNGLLFGDLVVPFVDELGLYRFGEASSFSEGDSLTTVHAHHLTTQIPPANLDAGNDSNHQSILLDSALSLDEETQDPLVEPVWHYLLTHETPALRIERQAENFLIYFTEGRLQVSADLSEWETFPSVTTFSPLSIPISSQQAPKAYFRVIED